MSTDKESSIIKLGILVFILMVLGSLLVSFNIYDALYLLVSLCVGIRYAMLRSKR